MEQNELVNTNSPEDEKRWCARFNCTEQELRDAVNRVGPLAPDVERELSTRPRTTTLPPLSGRL